MMPPEKKTRNILVTGADGLLGFRLRSWLKESQNSDDRFFFTGRRKSDDEDYFSCDLSRNDEVEVLINWAQPDIIIHGAAMTQVDACEEKPDECKAANVDAVEYLLKNAKTDCYFIFISTDFVFDGKKGLYTEEDEPNPISVYGKSKWDAEKMILESGKPHAILRTMLVYGYVPGLSRSNIVLWVKESLEKEKSITIVNDQFRCPTYVDDLAKACLLCLEKKPQGIFHISSDELLSIESFAREVARVWGFDENLIKPISTASLGQAAARPPVTGFKIDKAREAFGFCPLSVKKSLEEMKKVLSSQP